MIKIVHEHYIHFVPQQSGHDSEIIKLLKELKIINIENMAKTKQEFKDLKTDLQGSLANLAADIERLAEQNQRTDLTEDEEQEIFDDFSEIATALRTLAGQTPEPEVPPTPEV